MHAFFHLYTGNGSGLCLSFWTSLYGAGVGALRVYMYDNTTNSTGDPIWELYTGTLTPDQWYKGEVPLSLPRPFRVSNISFSAISNSKQIHIKLPISSKEIFFKLKNL